MNKSDKELVALLKEWKDEVLLVNKDYHTAITAIDTAVDELKNQKEKWYVKYWWAASVVGILIATTVLIVFFQRSNSCSLTLGAQEFNLNLKKSASECK